MKTKVVLLLILSALLVGGVSSLLMGSPQVSDIVIVNAKVYSPPNRFAEAIAIRGNKIQAIGKRADIEKLAGRNTLRIDADGATVSPAFNDAHVHMFSGSESLQQVDLLDAVSLEDIGNRIRSFSIAHPKNAVIVGRGWLYGFFENGLPTREQLDALIPDRPAVMKCYDGHSMWLNSQALKAAGITRDTKDPENGIVVRDAQGEPTGVLKESAMSLADGVLPKLTRAEKQETLRAAIREAHRLGVTSVQEAGIGLTELEVLDSLQKNGELNLRIHIALEGRPRMTEEEIDQLDALRARFKNLSIGAVKLYADGVIEAHTAALLQPYSNQPIRGLPEYTQEDMNRVIAALDRHGYQVMVHAIGDGGIRMTLDALEHATQVNPTPAKGRRHRLEHIESVSREDIPRFGKLGIIASMQPFHANPNSNIFNVWAVNLGPERSSRAWIWKSLQDAGGHLAFGTDWPVVGLDPIPGLHTAMTRQTLDGKPKDGFIPEQRLSLQDSLQAYTSGAAYAQFAEDEKGRLEAGMLADIVVWDRDIFAVPVEQVKDAKVMKTIYDGQVVFEYK
ncbi:MAG: amidohydrolase [Pirellulaceae bacterium]|nr:amidohydrolase [Pirellulaceae bacterium]